MVPYCKQIVFAESVHLDLKPLFSQRRRVAMTRRLICIFICHFYDFCKIDYENEKYETNPFIFVIIMVEIKRAILTAQITLTGTMSTVHIIIIPDRVRERGSSMIYYTGDIHGSADALVRFCINKIKKSQDV